MSFILGVFLLALIAAAMFALGYFTHPLIAALALIVIIAVAAFSQHGNGFSFMAFAIGLAAMVVANRIRSAHDFARFRKEDRMSEIAHDVLHPGIEEAEMLQIAESLRNHGIYPYGRLSEDGK